jgi:hypothetical protein
MKAVTDSTNVKVTSYQQLAFQPLHFAPYLRSAFSFDYPLPDIETFLHARACIRLFALRNKRQDLNFVRDLRHSDSQKPWSSATLKPNILRTQTTLETPLDFILGLFSRQNNPPLRFVEVALKLSAHVAAF